MFPKSLFTLLLAPLCILVGATPVEVAISAVTNFKSSIHDGSSLRFVADSGVCETTPGVHQMSGYIDIGKNMSMWFWFFEARESPETAPFTLWLNGGPGCSSMIGLFQENGPCLVNPDNKTTRINPYSWNNLSNMIYIDQPIGTGFSFGSDTVNSTEGAAPPVWKAFQILFESGQFSKFRSREFIFATESYGGHYGPSFIDYFNKQNAAIRSGCLKGEEIVVSALMINNGWFDSVIQDKAFIDFATNAPGYGQLQNDTVLKKINESYYEPNGCKEQGEACYAAGNSPSLDKICRAADDFCNNNVFLPAVGDRDSTDLRQNSSALFPPEFYVDFLGLPSIKRKIGAETSYQECPDAPYNLFVRTGDDAKTWLPQLGALADSRLKILIWAGDADINNWLGGHASVLAMNWYGQARLRSTPFRNMTVDGKIVAAVQNVDDFTFARVYASGHQVPAYQPKASLEIFKQVIHKQPLHSV